MLQCAMSLGTAVLGLLLLLGAGWTSELGLFGWVFLLLGALGVLFWFVLPVNNRR
jgi:hypothetical protein